jgi:hypothetical protein
LGCLYGYPLDARHDAAGGLITMPHTHCLVGENDIGKRKNIPINDYDQ